MPTELVSKVLTLLFTDLAGSTTLKTEKGDRAAGELISRHRDHVARIAQDNSGRIIDWAGDGCFLTFDAPSVAVRFALNLQQTHAEDADLPKVYIGIHMGEVSERSGTQGDGSAMKVEGLAVDIASRIQALALPGQILMSDAVFNSARQRLDSQDLDIRILWQAQWAYIFEGFDDPIQIGEVGIESISPFKSPAGSKKAHRTVTPAEEDTLGWRPAVGQAIPGRNNWVLDSQLGTGGFGEVWLAYNRNTSLKRVYKFCFEPDRLRGLKREVVLLRLLKESLGERKDIARVLDWDIDNPPYYIETEYTKGGDLKVWAESQGGLDKVPLEARIELVAQVAAALSAAHEAGVLHKDIKPANILIRYSIETGLPQISLTDFGIGLVTDPNALKDKGITAAGLTKTLVASESTSGSGTALYIAPEILEGKVPTRQSDIYSLGVILYQMVIGDLTHGVAPGWERDVDDEFVRKDIAECVDGTPERRFGDSANLAQRLRDLPERRQVAEKVVTRRRKKKGLIFAAAAAAIFTAVIYGGIAYNQRMKIEAQKKWAYETALPEIRKLLESDDNRAAYSLTMRARLFIPEDPTISEFIKQTSNEITFDTTPSGASISYKPYEGINDEWISAGDTPTNRTQLPYGYYKLRIQKNGYHDREVVVYVYPQGFFTKEQVAEYNAQGWPDTASRQFPLYEIGKVPTNMIAVEEGLHWYTASGLDRTIKFDYFFIDRTEVTNKEKN